MQYQSRKFIAFSIVCFFSCFSNSACQAESKFINDFVFGRVTGVTPGRAVVNIGYADRIRNYQLVSVFRFKGKKLQPVAAIRMSELNDVTSAGPVIGASSLKVGDIVVVPAEHLVPLTEGSSLEKYVAQSVLVDRQLEKRYSTRNSRDMAKKLLDQNSRLKRFRTNQYNEKYGLAKYKDKTLLQRETTRLENAKHSADAAESLMFLQMSTEIRILLAKFRANPRAEYELSVGELAAIKGLGKIKAARLTKPKAVKKPEEDTY